MTNSALYNDCNISACIITDGADLDKLFKAVRSCFSSCSEIVICANGKFDEVKFTFRNYSKVKVFPQVWEKDFSKARNEAIDKASGEWILIIDSDEELMTPIKYLSNDYDVYMAYMFTENIEMEAMHYEVRIFKNIPELRYKGKLHEQVTSHNKVCAKSNVKIQQFQVSGTKLIEKIQRNFEILETDIDNPFRDYFLCQLHNQAGDSLQAIESGERVIQSNKYPNEFKALVSYWVAIALQRFYGSNDACKQMLVLSLMFEPYQILSRMKLIEIMQGEKANEKLIADQFEAIKEITNGRSSNLPIEVYYTETNIKNKINNTSWH